MILEREKWKISGDLTIYSSENKIWLVNPEGLKKRDLLLLRRNVGDSKESRLETNEFQLRVRPDLRFEVLHEGAWKVVMNLVGTEYSGFILTQASVEKGVLSGTFEAIVCPLYPGKVFFVSQDMEEYDSCFDEMTRAFNVGMFKKTRKWIPGHRYDSAKVTYYYLGEYSVNMGPDIYGTEFFGSLRKAHIVCKNIRGCKTVSEVFLKYPLGHDGLEILETLPLMVDSGESLKDDLGGTMPGELSTAMFNKFLMEKRQPSEVLSALSYGTSQAERTIVDYAKEVYQDHLYKALVTYWKSSSSSDLGNESDLEETVREAIRIACKCINPHNVYSNLYYSGLYGELGLSLEKMTKEAISKFTFKNSVFTRFEDYLRWGPDYFKYHEIASPDKTLNQRVKSIYPGGSRKVETLEKTLGGACLAQEVKNIVDEATADISFDVTFYQDNDAFVRVKVTVDDLIKHRKGVQNMPETLKREIMANMFQSVIIEFDKNSPIK